MQVIASRERAHMPLVVWGGLRVGGSLPLELTVGDFSRSARM